MSRKRLEGGSSMFVDPYLLKILVCPVCREKVEEKEGALECRGCSRRYPVRDGIPVMLEEEAEKKG
jgi:uncharacterized protein YbaR (Trm112 family)